MNNTIEILNTLFLVCAILAGVFLALSVTLFFIFDIRTIFNIRTGRAKKKTVQEMQDANSRTEALKVSKTTGQRSRRGSLTGPLGNAPTSKKLRHSAEITPPPPPQPQPPQEAPAVPETELLAPETSVLQSQVSDIPETSVLNQTPVKNTAKTGGGQGIKVTKRVVLINTEEIVP